MDLLSASCKLQHRMVNVCLISLSQKLAKATENTWMLEAIARMAYFTVGINPHADAPGKTLHDRHYLRKHGQKAYYGQVRTKE
jgi:L-ribulose-5-phosphate 4-epimerase